MSTTMQELSSKVDQFNFKVDQLALESSQMRGELSQLKEAVVEVVNLQIENAKNTTLLNQLIKSNENLAADNKIFKKSIAAENEKLKDRIVDLEKVTNVNSLALGKYERFIWVIIAAGVGLIGKFLL